MKKSLTDAFLQMRKMREEINREYGRYDREFNMYLPPKKGEGKRKFDRLTNAYNSVVDKIESKLIELGAYENGYAGTKVFNHIMKV